jgi:hypothetical protein
MNTKKLSEKQYIYCEGDRELTVLTVHKLYRLLLLVEIGWRQGRALGSKEVKAMRSGLLSLQQIKESEHFGWVFKIVIGRLNNDETLMRLKGVFLD